MTAWVDRLGRLLRAVPPVRGKGFLSRRILAPLLRGRGYRTTVSLRTPGGGALLCDLDDWLPWNIYLHGRYLPERCYENYMLGRVRPGMTIFDVGANIGYYAVQFGRLLEGTGAVHAFEPFSRQFTLLCRHLQMNELGNVVAVQRIVSREPGVLRIYDAPPDNTGSCSLEIPSDRFEDVVAVNLDGYCRSLQIDRIDLMKIDVEGHEAAVLEGARELLQAGRIGALFVEVNSRIHADGAATGERLVTLLGGYGYRPTSIASGTPAPYQIGRDESLVLFERP